MAKKVKNRGDMEAPEKEKKRPAEPDSSPENKDEDNKDKQPRYTVASLSADSVAAAASAAARTVDAPVDFNIESLGIKPAASPTKPKNTYSSTIDKDSTLRVTVIKSPSKSALVFRVQPNMSNSNGAWAEKVFSDNVKNESNWVRALNIDSTFRYWFHNNIGQKNNRGYLMRLFTIFVEAVPTKEAIIQLGEHICQRINAHPHNDTTISVKQDSYFWLEDAVWADLIGSDQAYRALLMETSQTPGPGYFETYKSIIYSYFHPKTLSRELARMLHAPTGEIHPSVSDEKDGSPSGTEPEQ